MDVMIAIATGTRPEQVQGADSMTEGDIVAVHPSSDGIGTGEFNAWLWVMVTGPDDEVLKNLSQPWYDSVDDDGIGQDPLAKFRYKIDFDVLAEREPTLDLVRVRDPLDSYQPFCDASWSVRDTITGTQDDAVREGQGMYRLPVPWAIIVNHGQDVDPAYPEKSPCVDWVSLPSGYTWSFPWGARMADRQAPQWTKVEMPRMATGGPLIFIMDDQLSLADTNFSYEMRVKQVGAGEFISKNEPILINGLVWDKQLGVYL